MSYTDTVFIQHTAQFTALNLPPLAQWHQHYDGILITGPTASGKSALSMYLASLQASSIISVDSALVYKKMDIGTAKPNIVEQSLVPHYLLDLIEPTESYSVAQFLLDTTQAIVDCQNQGRLPILVGGTMMYVNALYQGLNELPMIDTVQRSLIVARANKYGWAALHTELTQLDPMTAARLSPNDAQRIERALSVVLSTGLPLSHWLAQSKSSRPLIKHHTIQFNEGINEGASLLNRCLHISIEPEKLLLWQRIEQRFDNMLNNGFLDEVTALMQRGDLSLNLPSMRCVGYRQAWQYFEALQNAQLPAYSLNHLRERSVIATRQLAKRQMTWLRQMPQRLILN
ncbi:MAG: tRNA ((37)-N6)-dimethylallyltransferase MiaA [Pseudomonadota bacterium]|jgi:tRNA dimethylallyltransferase